VALAVPLSALKERRRGLVAAIPVYWHLLSLDAPTVAVLWAWSLARAVRVAPPISDLAVLGIGTWLIYIGDRLLDGRPGADPNALRERHHFHGRHRRVLLIAGFGAAALLLVCIARMPAAARRDDAVLFAVAIAYFLAVHLPAAPVRFPRELAVGVLFACACTVPAWSQAQASHAALRWLCLLFAALCSLNCLAIHAWEQPEAATSRFFISVAALLVAATAGLFMVLTAAPGTLRLAAAVLAAALLLCALDRDRLRAQRRSPPEEALSPLALRILADAVLLTPLLLLIPWRL
jgi:hypothetical protein